MVRLLSAVWTAKPARRGYDKPRMTPHQRMLVSCYLNHRNRVWAWALGAQKEAP